MRMGAGEIALFLLLPQPEGTGFPSGGVGPLGHCGYDWRCFLSQEVESGVGFAESFPLMRREAKQCGALG